MVSGPTETDSWTTSLTTDAPLSCTAEVEYTSPREKGASTHALTPSVAVAIARTEDVTGMIAGSMIIEQIR